MSFTLNLERPAVTFVGRPLDLNKGLCTFLTAVDGLLGGQSPPEFQIWLVGGDEGERNSILRWILTCPRLTALHAAGWVRLWGMQPRSALPEIYSRSRLTVMPSRREQFGLVAIEAMMCGCPVVVTGAGGPGDTVLAGRTGSHVAVDDPAALRAVLAFYLRGPEMRSAISDRARTWAAYAFDLRKVYGQIADLYSTPKWPHLEAPTWDLPQAHAFAASGSQLAAVVQNLGRAADTVELIREDHHRLFRLQVGADRYALKIFAPAASHTSIIFPIGVPASVRSPTEQVANVRYHSGNPLLPSLAASDEKLGWALFDWIDGAPAEDLSLEEVRGISRRFSQYGSDSLDAADYSNWRQAAADLACGRSPADLVALDRLSITLNQKAEGAALDKRGVHPIAELLRITFVAERIGWEVPDDMSTAIAAAAQLALGLVAGEDEAPRLQHNDLKSEHVLKTANGLVCLDTEHALVAFGALDVGGWLASQVWQGVNAAEVLRTIVAAPWPQYERVTAVQWLICRLTGVYLSRVYAGSLGPATLHARRIWSDLLTELSTVAIQ